MLGNVEGKTPDKTRLCPSCRCEISILATRCRFCGEEVGRPRDEARHLSVEDLGGEGGTRYSPSGTVMEALESFRLEVCGEPQKPTPPPKRKSVFRRKRAQQEAAASPGRAATHDSDLPELDEDAKTLASLSLPSAPPRQAAAPPPSWTKKMAFLGAFIAALLILYFGGMRATAVIKSYIAKRNAPPVVEYENRAPFLQARGAPPIEVLQEAAKAYRMAPTEENRSIKEEAWRDLELRVRTLLNSPNWKLDALDTASQWASKAAEYDPTNPRARELSTELTNEVFDYKMTVKSIDDEHAAIISLNRPEGRKQIRVEKGDVIRDRFLVLRIGKSSIIVEDLKRNRRHLEYPLGRLPRQFES